MSRHSSRQAAKPAAKRARRASPEAAPNGGGKRERILDAAVRVFAQEGFYNAKVSQIAQEAGVADGTIYLYFKSKDDLLISLFEDRMERINANLRDALGQGKSAREKLRNVVRLHLELISQNRHMAEVICVELRQSSKFIREYANPKFAEFLRIIAGAVAEGQKSGELRSDVEPWLVARALFGALDEISLAWLVKSPKAMDLSHATQQLGHLFIDGLAARKGAEP
jgi:TetR/AcrR family fatty acid metabolism transcriptional regulator